MPKIHALKPQLWAMGNYINKKPMLVVFRAI